MSFFAYFSFFIYGYSLNEFNHYIVWPRFIASFLVFIILFEMYKDRKSTASVVSLGTAVLVYAVGIFGLIFNETLSTYANQVSTIFIVVITLLLAQGYMHQIKLIINTGKTGEIDIRMSQFILMMDLSTIAFAMTMGIAQGWPLMLLATVSAITKLIIMYLFRWVNLSPIAQKKRRLAS